MSRITWLSFLFSIAVLLGLASPGLSSADGVPDPTFGGDGRVTIDPVPGFSESPDRMAIDSMGRIVVVGNSFNSSLPNQGFVARFLDNGAPDPAFDGDGFKPFASGSAAIFTGLLIDAQDRITATGYRSGAGTGFDFFAARLLPSGNFDPDFSGDGIQSINFGGSATDVSNGSALDSQGRTVMVGYSNLSGSPGIAIARLKTDGTPDASISGGGFAIPDVGGTLSIGHAVAVDDQGRIVAGGVITVPGPATRFLAIRLRADGSFDPSFNGNGRQSIGFGPGVAATATDLVVDDSGRLVLAGVANDSVPVNDAAVARLTPGGVPDPAFSGDGVATAGSTDNDFARAVAIDSADRIVLAGGFSKAGSTAGDALIARFSDGGGLDTSFGENGLLREDFFAASADATPVLVDGQGRYLIAGRYLTGADERMGLARFTVEYPVVEPPPPPPPPPTAVARCAGKKVTVLGTAGNDRLNGTAARDVFAGLAGRDLIIGRKGNDLACGGGGNDRLRGNDGKDVLRGDNGADQLKGGDGPDLLVGGKGRDGLVGNGKKDRCRGGPGRDRLKSCERGRA